MQGSNSIEYLGWHLEDDGYEDWDGFWKSDWTAVYKDGYRQSLHASPYSFYPDQEQFIYLIDHGFPSSPHGNWFTTELRDLIMTEKRTVDTNVS